MFAFPVHFCKVLSSFFSFLWFDASISDLSGDPKQSRQNLHMYSREIMLMKKKQQEKKNLIMALHSPESQIKNSFIC